MVVTDTNNLLSGFQSLVGMGVATVRLVAAVLTVLGVWIHLDTLSYLSSHKPIQPPKPFHIAPHNPNFSILINYNVTVVPATGNEISNEV